MSRLVRNPSTRPASFSSFARKTSVARDEGGPSYLNQAETVSGAPKRRNGDAGQLSASRPPANRMATALGTPGSGAPSADQEGSPSATHAFPWPEKSPATFPAFSSSFQWPTSPEDGRAARGWAAV